MNLASLDCKISYANQDLDQNSILQSASCAMQMAVKNGQFFTSASPRIPAALESSHQMLMDFIMITIRQLGWQQPFLKSKCSLDMLDGILIIRIHSDTLKWWTCTSRGRTKRSASSWTILRVMTYPTSLKISILSCLSPIWPPTCSPLMQASSDASKLTIEKLSVFVPLS